MCDFIWFPVHRYLMYKVYKVAFYIPSTNDLELVRELMCMLKRATCIN